MFTVACLTNLVLIIDGETDIHGEELAQKGKINYESCGDIHEAILMDQTPEQQLSDSYIPKLAQTALFAEKVAQISL